MAKKNDFFDLSMDADAIPDEALPAEERVPLKSAAPVDEKPATPAPTSKPASKASDFPEFRGIGEIYARKPIGAVLQVGWRRPGTNGKWEFAGSFGGGGEDKHRCWNIMSAVCDATGKVGGKDAPIRTPHSAFTRFNTAHPSLCSTIRAVLVNVSEREVYRKKLGAYRAPMDGGHQSPPKGWWCEGDGRNAKRWVKGEFKNIPCPGSLCEFQQEGSGPRGKGVLCKCNTSLIAQFRWQQQELPQLIFQWDSKSWNNAGYLDGLFKQVDEAAAQLFKYEPGTFPLLGLPITLTLSQKTAPQKRFPVVSCSIDGDMMAWMMQAHQLNTQGKLLGHQGPQPLQLLPPEGYTAADMEDAREANLNPDYRPANER